MSKVILRKSGVVPNPGPYLKAVDGTNLLTVGGPELQATDILNTAYLQDVDSDYLFDTQGDAPSQTLSTETGYPIQSVSLDHVTQLVVDGGYVTQDGNYAYHTFLTNGTLSVAGGSVTVDYLIQAGGGAGDGGTPAEYYGPGGAGGTARTGASVVLPPGDYVVVVGEGGARGTGNEVPGEDGGDSSFNGVTATGGTTGNLTDTGGSNADYSGATNGTGSSPYASGGGAGAGSNGSGLSGGDGIEWPTGSGEYYGGGGTSRESTTNGTPGLGGGGVSNAPSDPYSLYMNGENGRGGGGAGGDNTVGGGNGGSGVVKVRYLVS